MRCVVSADGVNQAIAQSLKQGLLVAVRLNGWVAFDGKALLLIVVVVEPKVMGASLCRYLFYLSAECCS